MKIKIMQHFLYYALVTLQQKVGHLAPLPTKKFNIGDKVWIYGSYVGTVVKPENDNFDLTKNTWVHVPERGFASCYANSNLTFHPDQSRTIKSTFVVKSDDEVLKLPVEIDLKNNTFKFTK